MANRLSMNYHLLLAIEFGKGVSTTNLKQMRTFYSVYQKGQTLFDEFKLSWSHYLKLMRIEDKNERKFYEIEAINNGWSLRELKRQYDSGLYLRLSLNRDKEGIKELTEKGQVLEKPRQPILKIHIGF